MPKTRRIEFSIEWQIEGKPRKTPTQNSNEKKICIRKKEPKTSERDVAFTESRDGKSERRRGLDRDAFEMGMTV